jgi:Recombination enhancement, RecA-dependent nuclease
VTKAEKQYMGKVAELGCILCKHLNLGETPAELHHPRTGTGAGRRASNMDVIPLCPEHHRGNSGLHGMGRKAFEKYYGITELQLMEKVQECLR